MPLQNLNKPLLVIVGPTAVGKTELSICLAERLDGEIISADSRYFYKGMDIGTAKPTLQEMRNIPHHLVDVATPDQTWSLAIFQAAAQKVIEDVHRRGKLPILVGGTGQYIHAVLEGWEMSDQPPNQPLRDELERLAKLDGGKRLYEVLKIADPTAAGFIDPRNVRRTLRAWEVILTSGRRFSDQRRKDGSPYDHLIIGLIRPRDELYARVDQRIEMMVAQGFQQEVEALLASGCEANFPTMTAIGYREMCAVIQGKMTLEEAIIQMKRLTRNFVRRQANWFRANDPSIHWFRVQEGVLDEILPLIDDPRAWIKKSI